MIDEAKTQEQDMHTSCEAAIGWLAVVTGVVIAAAVAPWTSSFAPNFAAYWSPQLAVLLTIWLLKARPAAIAAAVLTLAAYLYAFDWWFFAHGQGDSMAWLGYLFSWPGGLLGAVAATLWMRRREDWSAAAVGATTGAAVFFGIIVNQTLVCSTVLYCGR